MDCHYPFFKTLLNSNVQNQHEIDIKDCLTTCAPKCRLKLHALGGEEDAFPRTEDHC